MTEPEPVPAVEGGRYRSEVFDAVNVAGIDADEHDLECSCKCAGDVLVVSEVGERGAYVASTVSVLTYYGTTDMS